MDFLLKTLNLENRREASPSVRIMFIVSYRPEFNLPDSWRSAADLLELDLKPLTDDDCEALPRRSIEDIDFIFDRKRKLLRKSEGNPLIQCFPIQRTCTTERLSNTRLL
jgi:predicted ATPase